VPRIVRCREGGKEGKSTPVPAYLHLQHHHTLTAYCVQPTQEEGGRLTICILLSALHLIALSAASLVAYSCSQASSKFAKRKEHQLLLLLIVDCAKDLGIQDDRGFQDHVNSFNYRAFTDIFHLFSKANTIFLLYCTHYYRESRMVLEVKDNRAAKIIY
jgi:hypothetical protein